VRTATLLGALFPASVVFAADQAAQGTPAEPATAEVTASPTPSPAQPAAFEPRIPGTQDIDNPFLRALVGGKFDLNIRWRYEFAEVGALDASHALTMRTRVGYTTGSYEGFQAAVQLHDNRPLDYSWYNAAGLNNQPGKSPIADPRDTALNQLWLDYDFTALSDNLPISLRVGRQRMALDDQRFVGNVGWRQLEQTFDAVRLTSKPIDDIEATYAYLWRINRVFGPDADRDFNSRSHILNVSYTGLPIGKLTGFAYLLDLRGGAVPVGETVSSQTYGLRLTGDVPISDALDFRYLASAAWQADYADNPSDYGAPYVGLEGRLVTHDGLFGGLGFELLGSDDGNAAFQTPLATLHAFNGFADAFLVTPPVGLRDYRAFVGTRLPAPLDGTLTLAGHYFTADDNTQSLGWEINAIATHRFNQYVSGLVKWAWFDGDAGLADIHRFWVQLELGF
jgi:hypothetical protein